MHLELPLETKRLGRHLQECKALNKGVEFEHDMVDDEENILPIVKKGSYLALLGDIFDGAKTRDGTYREFLLRQCPGYEAVFVLAGNHEYYRTEHGAGRAALKALCAEVTQLLGGTPTVHFMDRDRFDLPDQQLRILGCTLWSCVSPDAAQKVASSLSDYSAISVARANDLKEKATVDDTNAWHAQDLAWLEEELAQAQSDGCRCVVLTHHAPSFHGTCAPEHGQRSAISSGFCTGLERLLRPPVSAWLFGHTHWSSWQKYRSAEAESQVNGSPRTPRPWTTLSGGQHDSPCSSDFCSSSAVVEAAAQGEVLVASNQLGYGAQGGHRSSRCHPHMMLRLSNDGGRACLYCGP